MAKTKVPSEDKSGSATKTETERTEKKDGKKRSVQLSSSNDKKLREQNPTNMKIKIPETTRDDKIFSSMSASYEEGRIPKKQRNKVPEPLVTVNKVTQDPDDMHEDDKVGSSIEATKKTSVCVTPH